MQGGKTRDIAYNYIYTGSRFNQDLSFTHQYFNLYRNRLSKMRTKVQTEAYKKIFSERITEVKIGKEVLVIGIIIRSHKERISNIEKYIVKVGTMDPRPSLGNFSSNEDLLYIEDENGRLSVKTDMLNGCWGNLVTGVVIGIKGFIREDASLEAVEMLLPIVDLPQQVVQYRDELICFVAGLEVGNPNFSHTLLHVFADFLLGGLEDSEGSISGKIVRLVVLGDCIYKPVNARTVDRKAVGESELKGFKEMSSSLKQLDTIMAELAGIFPVDIVPGEMDPTNASLPQQPLSPYLFPKASVYSALRSVPNPYEFEIDGVKSLCTSGQNINSMSQYLPETMNDLEIMELTLRYRHIAPTAPDALQCIPIQNSDPFIIDQLPNLYIVGNMRGYKTAISSEGVRMIAVPRFSTTKSFVVMNRFSLESTAITLHEFI